MNTDFELREYKEDEVISNEGEVSTSLYCILEGNAASYIGYLHNGGYLVELLGPGRFCGEAGFLAGEKNTVTVVANGDLKVMVIDKDHFKQYLSQNPHAGIELMQHMARANGALARHIGIVSDELLDMIETIESRKPVPIDLKSKLLQYKMWK